MVDAGACCRDLCGAGHDTPRRVLVHGGKGAFSFDFVASHILLLYEQ